MNSYWFEQGLYRALNRLAKEISGKCLPGARLIMVNYLKLMY